MQENPLAGDDRSPADPKSSSESDRKRRSPHHRENRQNRDNKGRQASVVDRDLSAAMGADYAEAKSELGTSQRTRVGPPPAQSMVLSVAQTTGNFSMDETDIKAAKLLGQAEQKALSMMSAAERRKVLSLSPQEQQKYMKNRLRSAEKAATAQLMAAAQQAQLVRGSVPRHDPHRRSSLEQLDEVEMNALVEAAMNGSGIRGCLSGAASRARSHDGQRNINFGTEGSQRVLGQVARQAAVIADPSSIGASARAKDGRGSAFSDHNWNSPGIDHSNHGNGGGVQARGKYLNHTYGHPAGMGAFGAGTVAHEQLVLDRGRHMKMSHGGDDGNFGTSYGVSSNNYSPETHIGRGMTSSVDRTRRGPRYEWNDGKGSYAERSGLSQDSGGTQRTHGSPGARTGAPLSLTTGHSSELSNDSRAISSAHDAYIVAKLSPNVGLPASRTPTSPTLSSRELASPSFISQQHQARDNKGAVSDVVQNTAQRAAQRSGARDDAAQHVTQLTPGLLRHQARARALYEQERDMAIEAAIKNKVVLSLQDSQLADSRLLSLCEFHADQKRLCRRLLYENGPNAARNWQGRPSTRARGAASAGTRSRVSDGLWQMAAMQSAELVHAGTSQRDDRRMQLPDEVWEYGPTVEGMHMLVDPPRCSTAPAGMRHSDVNDTDRTHVSNGNSGVDARFTPRMASPGRRSPSHI